MSYEYIVSFFFGARKPIRPVKVCDVRRRKRICMDAQSWKQLVAKGCKVLSIPRSARSSLRIVQDENGYPCDKIAFAYLPYHTTLLFLVENQLWSKRPIYSKCPDCKKFHQEKLWSSFSCEPPQTGTKLVVKLLDKDRDLELCDVHAILKNELTIFNFSSVHFYWPEVDPIEGDFWRVEGRSYLHIFKPRVINYQNAKYRMVLHPDYVTNIPNVIRRH